MEVTTESPIAGQGQGQVPELPQPVEIPTYNWIDFKHGGVASHLYTVGVTRQGFEPLMVTELGATKKIDSIKHSTSFYVVYDKSYVLDVLCKQLGQLGVIFNGEVNTEGLDWLLNELKNYVPLYAEKEKNEATNPLSKKAKELAKQYPHLTYEQWLLNLEGLANPILPAQQQEKNPVIEDGISPTNTGKGRKPKP